MTGARQTIAVIITFRKSNKNPLERRTGAYWSSRKKRGIYCNTAHLRTKMCLAVSYNEISNGLGIAGTPG
jgi:hypothetical protein